MRPQKIGFRNTVRQTLMQICAGWGCNRRFLINLMFFSGVHNATLSNTSAQKKVHHWFFEDWKRHVFWPNVRKIHIWPTWVRKKIIFGRQLYLKDTKFWISSKLIHLRDSLFLVKAVKGSFFKCLPVTFIQLLLDSFEKRQRIKSTS